MESQNNLDADQGAASYNNQQRTQKTQQNKFWLQN
jgi:hypothetical protein